jgi:transcription initiation factor TFIIB
MSSSFRQRMNCISDDDAIWSLFDNVKNSVDNPKTDDIQERCFYCQSEDISLDDGNYICKGCGTLMERFIDSSAEWRFYGHEDNKTSDPTRCGLPTNVLLPESSLGTIIGMKGGECYEMRILRKYQMWHSMTYKERTLYNIFDSLTVNAVNFGIPSTIIDEAKALYKKFSELKLSRGENRSGLIATSIYMSCKTHNVPRSAKEIAKMFNIKSTTMTKGCKKFQEILQMELSNTTALDFIQRFCSKLNLDMKTKDICIQLVQKVIDLSIISENTPPSIAAGCIYLVLHVLKLDIDKKDLSEACDISMVTISKCFKKLWTYRQYIFTEEEHKLYGIT